MTSDTAPTRQEADAAMELGMGRLLIGGVLLASAAVLAGGILLLLQAHGARPDYRHFHSEPGQLRQPLAMVRAGLRGEPRSLIQMGILLLIATPVARVVFAVVAFARERDRLYVGISLLVLAVLLLGLFRVA